ncbi:MAG: SpoVA/SpoVAEb family sporulation membrane protein [Clostridiales bacterium]|nr:SpoVA/SpoVAEb family sporulation membrane protein [Clostridiales bacterium]
MNEKEYSQYIKEMTPTNNVWLDSFRAFLVGGSICLAGQILMNLYGSWGMEKEDASAWMLLTLIGLSVLFTGMNWFSRLAKFGGAGALVPITGFANSVAAPAIEFKKEGQVFGIGCKIFTIAGPVILYGVFTSWVLGLVYWVLKIMGIVG